MLTQHLIASFKITAVQNTNKQTKHGAKKCNTPQLSKKPGLE
jgi:hypothetical protein